MLIRSQDRKTVVNLSSALSLLVGRRNEYDHTNHMDNNFGVFTNGHQTVYCLGTYDTEQRAIEVLDDIFKLYGETKTLYSGNSYETRTYEMPQK